MVLKKILGLFKSDDKHVNQTQSTLQTTSENLADQKVEPEIKDDETQDKVLNITLSHSLNISEKLINILKAQGIHTVKDILKYNLEQILSFPNIDEETLTELMVLVLKLKNTKKISQAIANIRFDRQKELSARLINALRKENIYTIQDILKYTYRHIALLPNIGDSTLKELKIFLEAHGVLLGQVYEIIESGERTEPHKLSDVSAKEYILQNYDSRISAIIIERLEGKTLEEIGEQNNITRERVRQICKKLNWEKVDTLFKEDAWRNIFQKYKWEVKTFCSATKEPAFTFYYLHSRYQTGSIPVNQQENTSPDNESEISCESTRNTPSVFPLSVPNSNPRKDELSNSQEEVISESYAASGKIKYTRYKKDGIEYLRITRYRFPRRRK